MVAGLALRSVVVLLVLLTAGPVLADGRVGFLADRLRYPPPAGDADDFRVRINAALALGASNDEAAVAPLCAGLGDPSDAVRQAVAVAFKRLARSSSLDCMRKRASGEANASVKLQIQRAIEAVEKATAGGGASPDVAGARFYVAIAVVNETGRPGADIERLVRDAVVSRLAQLGAYQLAPAGESGVAASAVMARRKLRGYSLTVSVEKFDYSDGLRVRVKLAVSTYPGKDLRGEIPSSATAPGARPGDARAEDRLVTAVAEQATNLFAQTFR